MGYWRSFFLARPSFALSLGSWSGCSSGSCLTWLFSHCLTHIPVICEAAGKLFSPEGAQAQIALCYKLLRRTCHRSRHLSSQVSQAASATAAALLGEIVAGGERTVSLTICASTMCQDPSLRAFCALFLTLTQPSEVGINAPIL